MHSRHLLASRKARAGRACWSRPSTTTSRDRWRDAAPKRGAAISRKIVKWRAAADEEGTIASPYAMIQRSTLLDCPGRPWAADAAMMITRILDGATAYFR